MPDPDADFRAPARACPACAAPLADDQRYCLSCGECCAPRRVDPRAALGPALEAEADAEEALESWSGGPTLPTPRTAAALVLAMLGVGCLIGAAAGPNASDSLASGGQIALVGAPAPATPSSAAVDGAGLPDDTGDAGSSAAPTAEEPASDGGSDTTSDTDDSTTPQQTDDDTDDATPTEWALPAVKHVVVISLTGQDAAATFSADSDAPYLAKDLPAEGALLSGYRAVAHTSVADGIALLSGRGPNPDTEAGCPVYAPVPADASTDADAPSGCVYPKDTPTLASQLTDAGRTWRAYVEDIGNGGAGAPPTCRHPALGTPDPWRDPRPGDAYLTARNPFVWFDGIAQSPECPSGVVGLDALESDLADVELMPSFAYVVPNACHDGRDQPCAEGAPAGLAGADAFLKEWVPRILDGKAFRDSGLLVVTFDGQLSTPPAPDADPATVGAVAISPFIEPGTVVKHAYDPYALLRSVEDLFGLTPLGHAADDGLKGFGKGVYTRQP